MIDIVFGTVAHRFEDVGIAALGLIGDVGGRRFRGDLIRGRSERGVFSFRGIKSKRYKELSSV